MNTHHTIINKLHAEGCSCVISNGKDIRTFTRRGVIDLYNLLKQEPQFLKCASVADKVIGKAAAALLIEGGVTYIFTDLISEQALALLKEANVETEYINLVHHIENREKTDWCPLEKSCMPVNDIASIRSIIDAFIAKINS